MVCLGGYGTHWVPSLAMDELCVMLWDMARYQNYDIRSPYNREAALWAANQTTFKFPIDGRSSRDKRAALGRTEAAPEPIIAARPVRESIVILDMEIDLRPATVGPTDPTPPALAPRRPRM